TRELRADQVGERQRHLLRRGETVLAVQDHRVRAVEHQHRGRRGADRKSTRLNSSHGSISYAVFCLKKKKKHDNISKMQKAAKHKRRKRGLDLNQTSIASGGHVPVKIQHL